MAEQAAKEMRAIARMLLPATKDIADQVTDQLLRMVPELTPQRSGDEIELVRDSTEQNVGAVLSTLAFGIGPSSIEPPTATLDLLRVIVEDGGDTAALLRGYRVGHDLVWRIWSRHVREQAGKETVLDVLEVSSAHIFDFIDRACQEVVRRSTTLVSGDAETDHTGMRGQDPVSTSLEMDSVNASLRRETLANPADHYVALIAAPLDDAGRARAELQRMLAGVAAPSVLVPAAADAWCAWVRWPVAPSESTLEELAAITPVGVVLGIGEPGVGRDGLRRSLDQASVAHEIGTRSGRNRPRVLRYRAIESVALLCRDPVAARRFAERRLGPLAARDETCARLRATLREVFAQGQNRADAAKALNVHHKTVTYRLRQAEELLQHSLSADTLDIEIALLVDGFLND